MRTNDPTRLRLSHHYVGLEMPGSREERAPHGKDGTGRQDVQILYFSTHAPSLKVEAYENVRGGRAPQAACCVGPSNDGLTDVDLFRCICGCFDGVVLRVGRTWSTLYSFLCFRVFCGVRVRMARRNVAVRHGRSGMGRYRADKVPLSGTSLAKSGSQLTFHSGIRRRRRELLPRWDVSRRATAPLPSPREP
jgi:hypothetical protein